MPVINNIITSAIVNGGFVGNPAYSISTAPPLPTLPTATQILETYPSYGFSLRKMKTTQTQCIRVRRSSDNTEQDFAFAADKWVDRAAILDFVGSGDGFITTWYSPYNSGSGYNAICTVAGQQAYIVYQGVLETENDRPIANARGRSTYYYVPNLSAIGNNQLTLGVCCVVKGGAGIPVGFMSDRPWSTYARDVMYGDGTNAYMYAAQDNGDSLRTVVGCGNYSSALTVLGNVTYYSFAGQVHTARNGVAYTSGAGYNAGATRNVSAHGSWMGNVNGYGYWSGKLGEMCMYVDGAPYSMGADQKTNWGIT